MKVPRRTSTVGFFEKLLAWSVILSALVCGGGCSGKREVTGQVFVVTKGGENVKLGLVGIHVVGEKELAGIAGQVQRQAATNRANLELLKGLENDVQALVRNAPPKFALPLKRLEEAISRRRLAESIKDSPEVTLFRMLPPLITKTDADGLFVVQASEKDWLAARGQRRAGDSTETYLWVMQLVVGQKKLLVSNDRLLDDENELLRTLGEVSPVEAEIGAERSLVSWAAEQRTACQVALAEAKAKAEAEERERQRLAAEAKAAEEKAMAEAKAKVAAAEKALASKLGLSKPFVAGARGQAGDLAVRWIPSGQFTMGSPSSEPDRYSDEVQHEVVLTRWFFLAETECTQRQWEAVMGGNPSHFKGSDRPVEQVSWGEAEEYCRKLTAKQRAEGILAEGWEWRLPTEAEWEYAVRTGTTGPRYGELDAIAWHVGNSGRETHAVKQKTANAWGLHDMIGNVWEWCSDWRGDYPTGSVTDPTGPSSGSDRVYRGGSCRNDARDARSAGRNGDDPGYRGSGLGFRPALSSVR